ncbi:MAG: hypothetical protein NW201_04370 [Gemmatimonadales bacterium]|nr:hypothetical protein [Gemmatimonadales bacterium]
MDFLVGVVFFGGLFSYLVFKKTPVGDAVAERIRGGVPADGQVLARLDDLQHEVDELRHQLSDAQERLDFAERLLGRPAANVTTPSSPEAR